jgi:hypothetical protein
MYKQSWGRTSRWDAVRMGCPLAAAKKATHDALYWHLEGAGAHKKNPSY